MILAVSDSCDKLLINFKISPTSSGSKEEVGSSNKINSAGIYIALAIPKIFFCPPDNSLG